MKRWILLLVIVFCLFLLSSCFGPLPISELDIKDYPNKLTIKKEIGSCDFFENPNSYFDLEIVDADLIKTIVDDLNSLRIEKSPKKVTYCGYSYIIIGGNTDFTDFEVQIMDNYLYYSNYPHYAGENLPSYIITEGNLDILDELEFSFQHSFNFINTPTYLTIDKDDINEITKLKSNIYTSGDYIVNGNIINNLNNIKYKESKETIEITKYDYIIKWNDTQIKFFNKYFYLNDDPVLYEIVIGNINFFNQFNYEKMSFIFTNPSMITAKKDYPYNLDDSGCEYEILHITDSEKIDYIISNLNNLTFVKKGQTSFDLSLYEYILEFDDKIIYFLGTHEIVHDTFTEVGDYFLYKNNVYVMIEGNKNFMDSVIFIQKD